MKTLQIMTVVLIGLAALTPERLQAQTPAPFIPGAAPMTPPAYSPYLNLLRRDNPTYINYYGLVRPEVEFRKQIYGLQQGATADAAAISAVDASTGLPLTGHPTQFMNTSHFFLNRGGQGSPGTAPGTTAVRPAAAPAQSPH